MNTINKPSTNNLGGVVKLYAIPVADLVSIGKSSVTVSSTNNVLLIYCTPGTLSFSEEQQVLGGNNYFNTRIAGFVPADSDETRAWMVSLAGRKFVVLFQDGNGNYKLAGSATQQLRFSSTLSTGSDTSDRAGHNIQFAGRIATKAIFISQPVSWLTEGSV